MKFKHSAYELIYDRFWNIYVSPLDSMICEGAKSSNVFDVNTRFMKLIKKLTKEVKQILLSLDNPAVSFEDPASLTQYRQNIVKKTTEYFSSYMRMYPQHKKLVTNMLLELGICRNVPQRLGASEIGANDPIFCAIYSI